MARRDVQIPRLQPQIQTARLYQTSPTGALHPTPAEPGGPDSPTTYCLDRASGTEPAQWNLSLRCLTSKVLCSPPQPEISLRFASTEVQQPPIIRDDSAESNRLKCFVPPAWRNPPAIGRRRDNDRNQSMALRNRGRPLHCEAETAHRKIRPALLLHPIDLQGNGNAIQERAVSTVASNNLSFYE